MQKIGNSKPLALYREWWTVKSPLVKMIEWTYDVKRRNAFP